MSDQGDSSQPSVAARAARIIREDPFVRGCVLFCIFGLLLGVPVVNMLKKEPERSASAESMPSRVGEGSELPVGFDSSRAVTLCDLNMQRQVAARSSYKSEWRWQVVSKGDVVAIRRGFSAKNLQGVEFRSEYTCLVSADTGRIFGLQFSDAGREVTLGAGELGQ